MADSGSRYTSVCSFTTGSTSTISKYDNKRWFTSIIGSMIYTYLNNYYVIT